MCGLQGYQWMEQVFLVFDENYATRSFHKQQAASADKHVCECKVCYFQKGHKNISAEGRNEPFRWENNEMKVTLQTGVFIALCCNVLVAEEVGIHPEKIHVFDDEESIVSFSVTNSADTPNQSAPELRTAQVEDKSVAIVALSGTEWIKTDEVLTFGLQIKGKKIGRTQVVLNFSNLESGHVDLIVIKRHTSFDKSLSYLLGLLVVITNFGFGCNFDYTVGKELVKKPRPAAVGIGCKLVILPVVNCCQFILHFSEHL